ncbi:MAG: CPBP family intramembrane glutamic endopeptidase [Bacteroidota bacterium]
MDETTTNKKSNNPSLPVWGRIVLIIIAFLFLGGILQVIGALIAKIPLMQQSAFENISMSQQLILQLSTFIALIVIVYLFRSFIDNKSIKSMGFSLKNKVPDIMLGLIMALFIIGGGTLILYSLGYLSFSDFQFNPKTLLLTFILFLLVSFQEEILFRGYILNNLLTTRMNKYLALFISAILFALFHALNPNLSQVGFINLILAGILLGSTYIFTRNLWFPISLHLFWNFFQGPIFGYAVSGQNIDSMTLVKPIGNELINGGKFGFEGSVVCTMMTIIAIGLIVYYYNKNHNLSAHL